MLAGSSSRGLVSLLLDLYAYMPYIPILFLIFFW